MSCVNKNILLSIIMIEKVHKVIEDENHCQKCTRKYMSSQKNWLGCDTCWRWWHFQCAGLKAACLMKLNRRMRVWVGCCVIKSRSRGICGTGSGGHIISKKPSYHMPLKYLPTILANIIMHVWIKRVV